MNTKAKYTIIVFLLIVGFMSNGFCSIFSKSQMDRIDCSSQKMHLFYFYVSTERNKAITDAEITCGGREVKVKIPKWLDEVVTPMTKTVKWRDPAEGNLTEADLWQSVLAVSYEFLELVKKSFPKESGGASLPPDLLAKEYLDVQVRFKIALDRLYLARLADSMQGRARGLMATFTLMHEQFDGVLATISMGNDRRFARNVTSFAVLSENVFNQLFKTPRQSKKLKSVSKFEVLAPTFFTILVTIMFFISLLFYFGKRERGVKAIIAEFIQRSKKWTEDFNRQFLKVKVEFIILAPVVVFSLIGILTANFFVFVFCFLLGSAIGFRLPKIVLEILKKRRGQKIDSQLMDGLILLSNSLKSGMDIVQGFSLVSQDLLPPISEEFGLVLKNYKLGTPFEKALESMTERVESRLLSYMIKAIILQRQVGGNLTLIFSRIVENIREESKLQEKTKALTAQQKIQSVVVGIMPWILASIMFLFQKDAMINFYTTALGVGVLFFCIIWLGLGMAIVNKLSRVKV